VNDALRKRGYQRGERPLTARNQHTPWRLGITVKTNYDTVIAHENAERVRVQKCRRQPLSELGIFSLEEVFECRTISINCGTDLLDESLVSDDRRCPFGNLSSFNPTV